LMARARPAPRTLPGRAALFYCSTNTWDRGLAPRREGPKSKSAACQNLHNLLGGIDPVGQIIEPCAHIIACLVSLVEAPTFQTAMRGKLGKTIPFCKGAMISLYKQAHTWSSRSACALLSCKNPYWGFVLLPQLGNLSLNPFGATLAGWRKVAGLWQFVNLRRRLSRMMSGHDSAHRPGAPIILDSPKARYLANLGPTAFDSPDSSR
jgi:hypothetical protein